MASRKKELDAMAEEEIATYAYNMKPWYGAERVARDLRNVADMLDGDRDV